MNISIMKHPSAFLPIAMSFAALATVLAHVAMFGVAREADEGTAARIFQLFMIAQVHRYGSWRSSQSSGYRGLQSRRCWAIPDFCRRHPPDSRWDYRSG
jgi:hypothetical protein